MSDSSSGHNGRNILTAARDQLDVLSDEIRQERYERSLDEVLSQLAGQPLPSYRDGVEIVEKLNLVAKALGVNFKLAESGRRVNLRCVNPPRCKRGNFQARAADKTQKALFTGDTFPNLEIE